MKKFGWALTNLNKPATSKEDDRLVKEPAPEVVVERGLRAVASGVLWEHTLTTLVEVILGFAVGATAAILVGIALGKSVVVERVLSPYIVAAQAVAGFWPLSVPWTRRLVIAIAVFPALGGALALIYGIASGYWKS